MTDEVQELFGHGTAGTTETRRLALLTRHGKPLLYLPRNRTQASLALSLYPAQRARARLARRVIGLVCTGGLIRLLPSTTLMLPPDTPLGRFLIRQSTQQTLPDFAILAGNPNAPGRRFILLLFNDQDRPEAVVKTGVTPDAVRLLALEIAVLKDIPSTALGVPRLRAEHSAPDLHAFSLDYAAGGAPPAGTSQRLAEVLTSWVDTTRRVRAGDVAAWQRLTGACPDHPTLQAIRQRLEPAAFHPVLHHGDLAPWNIKVARNGSWQVLDWERGERTGLPCWDWFHYHVQVSSLVERLPADKLAQCVEGWLAADLLREYAARTGVEPLVRELLLAYLLYSVEITRPTEGLNATRDLLKVLTERWSAA